MKKEHTKSFFSSGNSESFFNEFLQKINLYNPLKKVSKYHKSTYYIAIIMPFSSRITQEIARGFMETLRATMQAAVKFIFFDGKSSLLQNRTNINKALESNFDLLFTMGIHTSCMAKDIVRYQRKSVPIVFSSVSTPAELDLVESEQRPGYNITGAAAEPQPRYFEQLELLLALKPETKKILYPFDPLGIVTEEQFVKPLQKFLNHRNVELLPVYSCTKKGLLDLISSSLHTTDVVFTGRGGMVIECTEQIATMCNQSHVTLISSDLYSVEKGAALSFGCPENLMGQTAAYQAKVILEQQIPARELPVVTPTMSYKLKINPKVLELQGLRLDPQLLFLIQHGRVI